MSATRRIVRDVRKYLFRIQIMILIMIVLIQVSLMMSTKNMSFDVKPKQPLGSDRRSREYDLMEHIFGSLFTNSSVFI